MSEEYVLNSTALKTAVAYSLIQEGSCPPDGIHRDLPVHRLNAKGNGNVVSNIYYFIDFLSQGVKICSVWGSLTSLPLENIKCYLVS